MPENSANGITKWLATTEIIMYLANQWLKHRADSKGISVDEALAQAEQEYAAAKQENEDLKKLGHE